MKVSRSLVGRPAPAAVRQAAKTLAGQATIHVLDPPVIVGAMGAEADAEISSDAAEIEDATKLIKAAKVTQVRRSTAKRVETSRPS